MKEICRQDNVFQNFHKRHFTDYNFKILLFLPRTKSISHTAVFFKSICLYFGFLCCCRFGKNIYKNALAANKGHGSNPTAHRTPHPPTHTHFLKWGEANFDYFS